jgi:hypothetical protein
LGFWLAHIFFSGESAWVVRFDMLTPLFIATERFDPTDGEKWQKYCEWAKIPALVEVVSLDALLCGHIIKEFQQCHPRSRKV